MDEGDFLVPHAETRIREPSDGRGMEADRQPRVGMASAEDPGNVQPTRRLLGWPSLATVSQGKVQQLQNSAAAAKYMLGLTATTLPPHAITRKIH